MTCAARGARTLACRACNRAGVRPSLISRGPLHGIDHDEFGGALGWFEFQAELLQPGRQ